MILVIVSIILFILGIIFCIGLIEDEPHGILITMSFAISYVLMLMFYVNKPKAIDVYRNRTTLEITYKDNIPVDSIAVFKE